jgi:hypothetical protein
VGKKVTVKTSETLARKGSQMQKSICLAAACLLAALGVVTPVKASSNGDAAVPFLRIVNSARAVAMGGAVVNLVDEEAPLYNPGAVGLFHLHKYLGVTSPNSTRWLPDVMGSDLRLTKFNVSAGYALAFGNKSSHYRPRIALAAAYSHMKLDFGTIPLDGGYSSKPYDKANGYTLAAGFDFFLRAGIGFTHKNITSDQSVPGYTSIGKSDATDYGVLVELPIADLLRRREVAKAPEESSLKFEFTPSIAYVKADDGDDMDYSGAWYNSPLPTASKTGLAVKVGIKRNQLPLTSLLLVHETEKDLYNEDRETKRRGVELALFDVLFARLGKLDDNWGQLHPYTFGFGLSVGGFLAWLESHHALHLSDSLRRFDLNFDYAQYEGGDYTLSGTKHYRLRLSI